jgi:DNA replication protein DnaC
MLYLLILCLIEPSIIVKNWPSNYVITLILDRLLENAHRIELKGNSMRKTKKLD